MHRLAPTTLLVSLPLFALPVAAQEHALVGAWTISYTAGMRMSGGTPTPITATGTLSFVVQGDSLVGTLVTDPIEGAPPRPPSRMAARHAAGEVTFVQRSPAQVNMNGEVREATGVSTWVLRADGDALQGTVQRRLEGLEGVQLPDQPAQPVTGRRK
jgi:hypothetical protein